MILYKKIRQWNSANKFCSRWDVSIESSTEDLCIYERSTKSYVSIISCKHDISIEDVCRYYVSIPYYFLNLISFKYQIQCNFFYLPPLTSVENYLRESKGNSGIITSWFKGRQR